VSDKDSKGVWLEWENLDALRFAIKEKRYHTAKTLIEAWIHRIRPITPKEEWISVEERLPGYYQATLIISNKLVQGLAYQRVPIEADGWFWEPTIPAIRESFDGSVEPDKVTHWIPLPSPPKDQTEKKERKIK